MADYHHCPTCGAVVTTHVDKARAWDAIAEKSQEIERLRKGMETIVASESDNPAPDSYFAGVNDMAAIARRTLETSLKEADHE